MTFTVEGLLALLQASEPGQDPDALTMRELTEKTGRSKCALADDLRPLIDAGKVIVIRQPFVRIDGARTTIPAYRVAG